MKLKSFVGEGFRNIESGKIEFSDGVNLLLGENAEGKTNAIEAIYFFARGRSFRTSDEKNLVGFGKDGFRIAIEYEEKGKLNKLEYASFGRQKRRIKNGYKIDKQREFIGNFKAVLFYPDDLLIVKEGPEYRRALVNVGLSQLYPLYTEKYAEYKRAVENRSALLKAASKGGAVSDDEILSWAGVLSESAAYIYEARASYIKKLEKYAALYMSEISGEREILTLDYISNIKENENPKETYKRLFSENTEKERLAGVTLYGPHRDDIDIKINGKSARLFSSQGQGRSIILSIKLAEGDVCREVSGESPVYLFDDVLSELDYTRQKYLLSKKGDKQIIISSCTNDGNIISADKIIRVSGGEYR